MVSDTNNRIYGTCKNNYGKHIMYLQVVHGLVVIVMMNTKGY